MKPHFLLLPLALLALAGCFTPRLQPHEGHVTVPGGRVWHRVAGSAPGTPLLVLHGGLGHWQSVAEGGFVVTRLTSTGAHLGPFNGRAATGKKVRISELAVHRIANGRSPSSGAARMH